MYIRIKTRRLHARKGAEPDCSLRFLIVESHRTNGVPRQRIIKYLGSTKISKMQNPIERSRFLASLEYKLENMEYEIPFPKMIRLKLSLIRLMSRLPKPPAPSRR